jgi:hypothetical protein
MTVVSSPVRSERTSNDRRLPISVRRKVGIGVAAMAAVLSVAGCKPAAAGTPVPNVVGMHGDKAEDALQKPDAYIAKDVTFQDVKAGETSARDVILKSNWKVCAQAPAAGSPSVKNMTVRLYVVKNEENCPGASPTPLPTVTSAPTAVPSGHTETATPAPNTAPATPVPAPAGTTHPPVNTYSPPPTSAVAPTTQAPDPAGSCKAHTVAYCGWDRGEAPEQPGETATCKDGYVSFAGDDGSGTCSGHKGVRVWFK